MTGKRWKIIKIVVSVLVLLSLTFFQVPGFLYLRIGGTTASNYNSRGASVEYTRSGFSRDGYAYIVQPADRDLKILLLADPQVDASNRYAYMGADNDKTYRFVDALVKNVQPDLVVFLGDMSLTRSVNNWPSLQRYAEIMEENETLWAMCFGNHDCQLEYVNEYSTTGTAEGQMPKRKVRRALARYKHCLVSPRSNNYIINIKNEDGDYLRSLVFFDTAFNTETHTSTCLNKEQIEWYNEEIENINRLQRRHTKDEDAVVPTTVFAHVPPVEYMKVAVEYLANGSVENMQYIYGDVVDGINVDTRFYPYAYALSDDDAFNNFLRGTTDSVYFGHWHDNDMSFVYNGICLTSVQHSGFGHVYRFTVEGDVVDVRRIFQYGDNRGGVLLEIDGNGDYTQTRLLAREILADYYENFAIDYAYWIEKLKREGGYTVIE